MKKLSAIILGIFMLSAVHGQHQEFLDSIDQLSFRKIDNLTVIFGRQNDTIRQRLAARYLINKSKKNSDHYYLARGYQTMYELSLNPSEKLKYSDSMLNSATLNGNKRLLSDANYCFANSLYTLGKYRDALENFAKAYDFANESNYSSKLLSIETRTAAIKNLLGRHYEALEIYKTSLSSYNGKKFAKIKPKARYLALLYNIGLTHFYKEEYDSTLALAKRGKILLTAYPNDEYNTAFTYTEALGNLGKGNYIKAISQLKSTLDTINPYKRSNTYFYIGQSFDKLAQKDSSNHYYIKCLDLIEKHNMGVYPELKGVYKQLYNHHKDDNNSFAANLYLRKYFTTDSLLEKRNADVGDKIHKIYDLPQARKKGQRYVLARRIVFVLIFLLILGLILFFIYYRKQRKKLKKQRELSRKFLDSEESVTLFAAQKKAKNVKESKLNILKKETKNYLQQKIDHFEKSKEYLDKGITLAKLADEWGVHIPELSKMFNQELKMDFPYFLRSLRINNAVISLKDNPNYIKYSIKGLADEFGFTNPDTFSRSFKEITKIKPSVFIEELKNHHKTSDNS